MKTLSRPHPVSGLPFLSSGRENNHRQATLIHRQTGNLRAIQLLLGHTEIESTVRYLDIAEKVDMWTGGQGACALPFLPDYNTVLS